MTTQQPNTSWKSIIALVFGGLALLVLLIGAFKSVVWLDAKHVMVIQYPNGAIKTFTEPGPQPQWFGTPTKYSRRVTYDFSNSDKCAQRNKDGYIPFSMQFSDGGKADLCGSIQWEMPVKPDMLVKLQKDYASEESIDQQLVKSSLNNAIYFAAPTMTSIESTAERKTELFQYIDDQLRHGVYQVKVHQNKIIDPVTKIEHTINTMEIVRDEKGQPLRSKVSPMDEYGITVVQLAVSEIHYDEAVKDQIKARQNSINAVQLSIADATRAQQNKITIEANGAAKAAQAKWDQETVKAKVITEAQQELEVAQLNAKAAEQTKLKETLLGQGEAARKQLIMNADGALEKKLAAFVEINKAYAEAIQKYEGNWVPGVMMGASSSTSGGNQGLAMVELLTAKTARDLGLDMTVNGKANTEKTKKQK